MMKKVIVSFVLATLLAGPHGHASELDDQIDQARQQLDEAARKLAELHQQNFSFIGHDGRQGGAMLGVMLGKVSEHGPGAESDGDSADDSPNGVEIMGVTPGGGAEAAGLQAGDLITSIGAMSLVDVDEPMQALVSHMKSVEPGEAVMVDYLRDGVYASTAITTQERSAHMATFFREGDFDGDFDVDFDFDFKFDEFADGVDFSAVIPSVTSSVEHGSHLMSVEGELAQYFAVDKGVLVVSPPRQDSELKGGDIILSVGGEVITDVQQAHQHLAAIDDVVDVNVMRSGQEYIVSVSAGEFEAHEINVIRIQRAVKD